MIVTFFDTETTGLMEFKLPNNHHKQPHVVQLALLMMDSKTRAVLKKASFIVSAPFADDNEAIKTHGITPEVSSRLGVMPKTAGAMFKHFATRSDRLVAHNKSFDLRILQILHIRENMDWSYSMKLDVVCTKEKSRPVVKLPPSEKMVAAGMGGFKDPKLSEAYEFMFDEELVGAHDAFVDTEACARVYFWLLDQGHIEEPT